MKVARVPTETISEAAKIYDRGGLPSLSRATGKFVRRQLLKPWHITGDDIYAKSDRTVSVQSSETKTVRYTGRFRDSLPWRLAAIEGEIETPERVVAEYGDACLLGPNGIVRVGNGYVVPVEVGSERRYSPRLAENVSIVDVLRGYAGYDSVDRELDRAFLLTGGRGMPFAHWFYETLPKLRWYERYCSVIGHEPPLVLPSGLTGWQRESLALMGYAADSWIEQREVITRVKRLAVPPHPYRNRGSRFTGSPANLRWIRNRILSNTSESDRSFANRIYISRADASRRRIRNEDELVNALAGEGFVKYVPSELSFEDQVRLFAGAGVIIGPHGAGLTNMIYSTNASVVDMFTNEGANEHFFVLANELDHSYEFVLCEPADDDDSPPRHKDMIADVASVKDVIADY